MTYLLCQVYSTSVYVIHMAYSVISLVYYLHCPGLPSLDVSKYPKLELDSCAFIFFVIFRLVNNAG